MEEAGRAGAVGVIEHAADLVADAFARDADEVARVAADRFGGAGLDLEAEAGGESDGAEGAEIVLAEAARRGRPRRELPLT